MILKKSLRPKTKSSLFLWSEDRNSLRLLKNSEQGSTLETCGVWQLDANKKKLVRFGSKDYLSEGQYKEKYYLQRQHFSLSVLPY